MPQEDDNQQHPLYVVEMLKKWMKRKDKKMIDTILGRDEEGPQIFNDLEIVELNKRFGQCQVLKGINLKFNKGNLYCLLGHNGAGKSTFVNILTGIYSPSEGNIYWKGKDFRVLKKSEETKLNIGVCPSFDCLQENLTVYQHLKIICLIKQIPKINVEIDRIMALLSISEYRNFKTKQLSGGNKRKLTLAISLIGNPQVVFLDEPTSSIDPKSRKDIWEVLLKLKENKDMIMVLTTHHLEEAETLSDSISVLFQGQIIVQGSVNDIKKKFGVGYQIDIFPTSDKKSFQEEMHSFYQ